MDLSDSDITVVTGARPEGKEGTARGAGVMGKILDFKQRRQQRAAVGGCLTCVTCKVAVCFI